MKNINELSKIASELDKMGYYEQADYIDRILFRLAQGNPREEMESLVVELEELESDIIPYAGGEYDEELFSILPDISKLVEYRLGDSNQTIINMAREADNLKNNIVAFWGKYKEHLRNMTKQIVLNKEELENYLEE